MLYVFSQSGLKPSSYHRSLSWEMVGSWDFSVDSLVLCLIEPSRQSCGGVRTFRPYRWEAGLEGWSLWQWPQSQCTAKPGVEPGQPDSQTGACFFPALRSPGLSRHGKGERCIYPSNPHLCLPSGRHCSREPGFLTLPSSNRDFKQSLYLPDSVSSPVKWLRQAAWTCQGFYEVETGKA